MTESYPALIELIGRLEGKDKKTCELALYCLNKADKREKRLRAENERLSAALKPFAAVAELFVDEAPNTLTVREFLGRFRAAAAALNQE